VIDANDPRTYRELDWSDVRADDERRDEDTHDDELGYDADHNDDSQYCIHGTFIGSWWGPDYLCGWCEDGVSVAEMHAYYRTQRERKVRDTLRIRDAVVKAVPITAQSLDWWVRYGQVLLDQHRITAEEIDRLEEP
jgi:hypothetical protein